MNVKFTIPPQSQEVIAMLMSTSTRFKKARERAVKEMATQCADLVKTGIQQETFDFVMLAPGYFARKRKAGLDTRTLIATGDYVRSIKPQRVGDGVWGVVADAVKSSAAEHGSERQKRPARPHWSVALAQMSAVSKDVFVQNVMRDLFHT